MFLAWGFNGVRTEYVGIVLYSLFLPCTPNRQRFETSLSGVLVLVRLCACEEDYSALQLKT